MYMYMGLQFLGLSVMFEVHVGLCTRPPDNLLNIII